MNNTVIKTLNYIDILPETYVVVGVSAGPDSMALLDMLKKKIKKQIVCAHINHNVRKESPVEEEFLKNYCKYHKIIFESTKIEKYTENNFENEARKKRYAFFEKILDKYHSKTLILAHHGDDLIETVLMKIERGSNLEGYAGIKTFQKEKNYTIIRPLLPLTKEDLINYNQKNNITYYIDKSNNDTKYKRNRFRKNILPLLKKENPDIHLKFLRYSETLQEYNSYVNEIIKEKVDKLYKKNTLNIDLLNKEPYFIKKNIIFHILRSIYNNENNIIKESHIEEIIRLIDDIIPNKWINLPLNYIAKKEYNQLSFTKKEKIKDYKILFEGNTRINDFTIKKLNEIEIDDNNVCRLNSKDIKLPLYIRNRRNGDKIDVLGLNGTKKIKEIFIEKKIPISKRETYPLLVDSNDTILWIPNIKKSKYNAKKNELYDIILYSYKEREEKNES